MELRLLQLACLIKNSRNGPGGHLAGLAKPFPVKSTIHLAQSPQIRVFVAHYASETDQMALSDSSATRKPVIGGIIVKEHRLDGGKTLAELLSLVSQSR